MSRVKNNLSTFDIEQIEADLFAVESETLGLETLAPLDTKPVSQVEDGPNTSPGSLDAQKFKSHPVNVVSFTPESSKLLHKVLREDRRTDRGVSETTPLGGDYPQKPKQESPAKIQTVGGFKNAVLTPKVTASQKFKVSLPKVRGNASSQGQGPAYGMDGFKKATPLAISKPVSISNSVALTGMKRANQFNRYVLEQHGTSLQNQIEKQSLFERSLDGDVEIFDKGLQTNSGRKVYNVKRRKSMLGGVDQHNLGPGKVRRLLGYRSVKFLTPIFALLVLGTYVMYLNMPSISIKVAESKSGVAVSEPSYKPEGYKLSGPIEANTGQVAMNFKKGEQAFNVNQKVSDWDSKALLENKILKETKEYSAYTDRGLTIYVYDGKATWVNQGKVFEIKLNGSKLDTDEMIRIAGSM